MKRCFRRMTTFCAVVALTLGIGLSLSNKSEILSTRALEELTVKTLAFPDDNKDNNKFSGYSGSFTSIIGEDSWLITNFNNNSWNNDWNFIRCGSKSAASVATIVNVNPFTVSITKVSVTIPTVSADKINSTKLLVATDANFTTNLQTINGPEIKTGIMTYVIPTPTPNAFYKLSYDCQKDKNGLLTVSEINYFTEVNYEYEALEFANSVNAGIGSTAEGNCATTLTTLQNEYSSLSEGAKEVFDTSMDQDFVDARARMSYLESWVGTHGGETVVTRNTNNSSSNNVIAIVSIGTLSLTSILGFYFINKKRA